MIGSAAGPAPAEPVQGQPPSPLDPQSGEPAEGLVRRADITEPGADGIKTGEWQVAEVTGWRVSGVTCCPRSRWACWGVGVGCVRL